jgi:plastocyanin
MFKRPHRRFLWCIVALLASSAATLVLLGLSGCTSSDTGITEIREHDVFMTASEVFAPVIISVKSGEWVEWKNVDTSDHSVMVDSLDAAVGGPDSDVQFPAGMITGERYRWKVPAGSAPGTVWFYHDEFNGTAGDGAHLGVGMTGEIIVE